MKKFMAWLFLDNSWNGLCKGLIAILIFSAVVATGIVWTMNTLNQNAIEACQELEGSLTTRGYSCVLSTGEIVSPVTYLEGLE